MRKQEEGFETQHAWEANPLSKNTSASARRRIFNSSASDLSLAANHEIFARTILTL
jgi:hypothetical protein